MRFFVITIILLLTGCAGAPGLPGIVALTVLLTVFCSCSSLLDLKETDHTDSFLLRHLIRRATSSSSSASGDACTGTQDYTQSFDLSTVDPATAGIGFKIAGEAAGDKLGIEVGSAGDFNGDGINDIIVAAPNYSTSTGRVYIIFGRSGSGGDIDTTTLTTSDGIHITGDTSDYLGDDQVASAGDVNGDGFDDVLIASDYPNSTRGRTYLIFGSANPANITLSALTTSEGIRFQGATTNDYSGRSAAGLGDINGDGLDDFVIGQYYGSGGDGEANIVLGRSSWASNLSTGSITGTYGFTIIGESSNYAGNSTASAGDLNGDGFNDILIGAPGGDGSAFVVYGASGTGTDFATPSGLGASGYEVSGFSSNGFGFSVTGNGDFNGDGQLDFALSAQSYGANGGRTYIILGDSGTLSLSALTASQGFSLDGDAAGNERAGYGTSLGDVNGDGKDDLFVGAPKADRTGTNTGSAYLIFGQTGISGPTGALLTTYADGTQGIRLDGAIASEGIGESLELADVNGDGCADMLIGGTVGGAGVDHAYVIFGGQAQ